MFIDKFFGFTVYIRIMVTSFQVLVLSSFSEIYRWDHSSYKRLISLAIALIIMLITTVFFFSSHYIIVRIKESEPNKYVRFQEFFAGMKLTTSGRVYPILSIMMRRLFYIPLLVVVPYVSIQLSVILISEL